MNNDWISEAYELYNNGMTYAAIGKKLGIGRKTVSIRLRQLGCKSNVKYIRHVDPIKLRKYDYSYAENVFERIDTEEKAYWLGFLYADGAVSYRNNTVALAF